MQAKELIKRLQKFHPETEVVFKMRDDVWSVFHVKEDEGISYNDEWDLLSEYPSLQSMEAAYDHDQLDFFSVAVIS